MSDLKDLQNKVIETSKALTDNGADMEQVNALVDAVGRLATSIAVEATSKGFIATIKRAAAEGKKANGNANKTVKPEKEDS